MSRRFRIFYYTTMTVLLLVLSYHAYLLVGILFEMPDYGLGILKFPW